MSKITITRTAAPMPPEAELVGARRVLFDCLAGLSEEDNTRWRRLWKRMIGAEAGEMLEVELNFPRNPRFHRKMFALLTIGYEAWGAAGTRTHKTHSGYEIQKNFEQFREDILILSGNYTQTFNLKGEICLRAKSLSFAAMDDAEFAVVYESVLTVILNRLCTQYKDRDELNAVVERVLGFAS